MLQRQAVPVRGARQRWFLSVLAAALIVSITKTASPVFAAEPEVPDGYAEAVQAYRAENYTAAQGMFARLHRDYPENSRVTYYLAITEAQQGDVKEARRLYHEILLLDPNGKAAKLAREGLTYLPPEPAREQNNTLDAPPQVFSASHTGAFPRIEPEGSPPKSVKQSASIAATATATANHQTEASQQSSSASTPWPGMNAATPAAEPNPNSATAQTVNGMSPQDMMMWQMMMSQGSSNNGMGGMNPMMLAPQMFGTRNGANGTPSNMDPNIMSTLLMNQMMQNFSFDTNRDSDR